MDDTRKTKAQLIDENEALSKQLILDATLDSYILVDSEGCIIDVNSSYIELIGYSREELLTMNIRQLEAGIPPEEIEHRIQQMLARGKERFVTKHKHKNGNILDIEISITRLYVDEKFVVAAFMRNITESKRTNEALRDSEYLLRESQAIGAIGSYILDIQSNIWNSSSILKDIFGIDNHYSSDVSAWIQIVHPDDRSMMQEYFQKNILVDHEAFDKEYRIMRINDQAERWVHGFGKLEFAEDGNLVRMVGTIQDITERKNVEEALRVSEQRFRTIIEQARDALFMVDYEGRIVEVNDKACENLGYTRQELLSMNMGKIDLTFHGRDLAKDKDIWSKLGRGEDVYLETSHRRKDGSMLPVESSLGIVEINHKKVILGFARDITFRKKAEETVLKLNTAINNSSEVIFMTDREGNFTFVNSEFTRLYGYTEDEVLGKVSPRILKSGLIPRETSESLWKALLNKQHIPASQYVNRCKDGKLVDIEGSAEPILHEDGRIIGFLGIQRDITKRKRNEQIQAVLYQISNAVNTFDNLNHLLSYIQQVLGSVIDTSNFYVALYDENTDLISFPIFIDEKDVLDSVPQGKTLPRHIISIQKPLLIQREEIDRLKQSGEIESYGTTAEVWLGVPLKVKGKVTGVLVVQSYRDRLAFNETDLKMLEFVSDQISLSIHRIIAEQDLRDALEKAKESDRLKSTFLASMSHELRTPLNAIIGFSDIMDHNLTVNEMVEYSDIINTSGNQLLGIVEDLFDITLIDTGEMRIQKKKENLATLMKYVYEIIDVERYTISKDHLELKMILPPDHHKLLVDTDSVKFKQILINLLRNALKFTRKGHVHFGYTLEHDHGQAVVRFYVKDTGLGIPESKRDIIFDMFRQVEETSTRTLGGTGLGLSIAKKLSELLGGRIWFDSEEGKGTIFYFTLPYEEEAMDEGKEDPAKESPLVTRGDQAKKTILVVEDDESSFQFLKVVLEKNGYQYHWAENGLQAIEHCRANSDIDLVLMDMNMPQMNGFEATKSIRQSYPRLPIIAQTAFAVAGDREKALAAGCNDYISKPINRAELLDKIKSYLPIPQ